MPLWINLLIIFGTVYILGIFILIANFIWNRISPNKQAIIGNVLIGTIIISVVFSMIYGLFFAEKDYCPYELGPSEGYYKEYGPLF